MDAASQERFDALRRRHYPAELNQIAAHLTLFHALPDSEEIRQTLMAEAASRVCFSLRVTGVRSMGRGVAYFLESAELADLHARLVSRFEPHLSAQDRQGFRPHVVVQNKVNVAEARALLEKLLDDFVSWEVRAEGMAWWDYLGGPWKLREGFALRSLTAMR